MDWVFIQGSHSRRFFRPSQVVEVVEPIDCESGLKPLAWPDDAEGMIQLLDKTEMFFRKEEWPQVLDALGISNTKRIKSI